MKTLNIVLMGRQGSERKDYEVRFRKIESANGRHVTTCLICSERNEEGFFTRFASAQAILGKSDAREGRYNFIAGCRISFAKALARAFTLDYSLDTLRKLRHGVQLELSIAENDRAGREAARKLCGLVRQHDTLEALKLQMLTPSFAAQVDAEMLSADCAECQGNPTCCESKGCA